MQLRGVFKYRKDAEGKYLGNCFSVCVINGLQLQDDPLIIGDKPEIVVFSEKLLNASNYANELSVALTYFLKNSYEVKIIDPDPMRDNLWGGNYKENLLDGKPRNYEEKDIHKYVKGGWCVIFSTLSTNGKPHAILANRSNLYDPENEILWKSPRTLKKYLEQADREPLGKYLIAFRKSKRKENK